MIMQKEEALKEGAMKEGALKEGALTAAARGRRGAAAGMRTV